MTRPFFSVCIETYNREKTIFDTLKSVQNQTFRDFEAIIVDNKSTDNTAQEIKRFFQSNHYEEWPFEYTFKENKEHLDGVKNWNEPLKLARGKYIAVLEGDDQFLPTHLEEVHRTLTNYDKIGIYATGNQYTPRPLTGLIEPKTYFRYTYKMENVSPPSETIFIRKYNNKQYFYSDKDCIYCPEVALYLEISNDDLRTYHDNKQNVFRGASSSEIGYTWIPFKDRFKVISKYKNHKYINKEKYFETLNFQINNAFRTYINAKIRNIGKPDEIFHGIKNVLQKEFHFKHYKLILLKMFIDILIKYKLIHILKKLKKLVPMYFVFRIRQRTRIRNKKVGIVFFRGNF